MMSSIVVHESRRIDGAAPPVGSTIACGEIKKSTPSRQDFTSTKDASDIQRTKLKHHDFSYTPISLMTKSSFSSGM